VWNEAGTFLDFSVAPAYYQTNWFRLSCVAALAALLWMIYKLRVRSIQQRSDATGYACRSASSACFLFQICASNFALISRR